MTKVGSAAPPFRDSSELARLAGARRAGLRTILFVCSGNSIRSQMAEALVNHHYAGRWAAFSAGTLPRPLHAETVSVLAEAGIDASAQAAKSAELFRDSPIDRVAILCADANRHCPTFDQAGATDRLIFDDPLWTDALAGAVVLSYKPRLRDLRTSMVRRLSAYLEGGPIASDAASAWPLARWWQRLAHRPTTPTAATPDRAQRKYEAFKSLLALNQASLEGIARLESLYYGASALGMAGVRAIYLELLQALFGLVYAYEKLAGRSQSALLVTLRSIDAAVGPFCDPPTAAEQGRALVLPFAAIDEASRPIVGAKAANLALIGSQLRLPVPAGFAITAHAYRRFLADNGLDTLIERELATMDGSDGDAESRCRHIRASILGSRVADDLVAAIESAFIALEVQTGAPLRVAMRSSAIGEDTEPSFAGQYETVLNVGREGIVDAYRQVLASKYSPQAVSYRQRYGLEDAETPMCVAAVAMVEARASGVVYSRDPVNPAEPGIAVSAILGLGEQLVDGSATPDLIRVDRDDGRILDRRIVAKRWRLVGRAAGGVDLEPTAPCEQLAAAIDDDTARQLADYCRRLEAYFGGPQDIEWATDAGGDIFLLQARPLALSTPDAADRGCLHVAGHPLVLERGVMASPGIAVGTAFVVRRDEDLAILPEDAILIVATAAPKYARVASRIRGLIADSGSAASHLASVAREFGLPALFDTKIATRTLMTGDLITLAAESVAVYAGIVPELAALARPQRPVIAGSPAHRRTRAMLDRITPLTLTDPDAPEFAAERCRTCHDIVRYVHEQAMREMFGWSSAPTERTSMRLHSRLPIEIQLIDLGGGLLPATAAGDVTPDAIACRPLAALWRGFNHPGIDWRGTMNAGDGLAARLAAPAIAEFGESPGGASYALISADYLNFSLRFGYHFATLDALCGEAAAQNYVSLQFAGGGGSYFGRSLRIQFLAAVLQQLDFEVRATGDLLQARLARHDEAEMADRLDQLGRLLASSRLLDMALAVPEDIERCRRQFFLGDYRLLTEPEADRPASLYVQEGLWRIVRDDGRDYCLHDGAPFGRGLGARLTGTLARVAGSGRTTAFLDNLAAYQCFPLAVSRHAISGPATVRLRVRPTGGRIDRAGGIAFAIRDADNYLVFRINAAEQNAMLFEFRNGRREALAEAPLRIATGLWYDLQVDIGDRGIMAGVDGERKLSLPDQRAAAGFVGLWTKADSTVWFDAFTVEAGGQVQRIDF